MKNKSLFNQISLLISIVILLLILLLSILGSFNRVGYLSDFKLISSKNNIYTYQFRIKYHSKIFRNSDIYGVYINSKNIINANKYIRKITMNEVGSPFGILESNNKINGDINNIVYTLKLKKPILILSSVFVIILLLYSVILDFLKKLSKINFRNKYAYILIIFLCFLIMPNIIYKVFYDKFDHTNYENKKFAQKPELNLKKLEKYPKLYETYFNDYIPFRNELIQIKNLMDIFVFDYIIHNLTVIGKNKWLFFKTDRLFDQYIGIDKYFFTDKELEEAKYNLINFRDELKKRNIDFVLLICPDKQIIYSNYMPDYIQKKNDIDFIDQFVSYMSNNSDIKIIYPKNELLKYKDRYQLYYKYDTHWNNLGGYIAYTEFLKKMNFEFKNIEHFNILSKYSDEIDTGLYYNDLSKAINLKNIKYFNDDLIYYIDQYVYYNDKEDIYKWRDYKTRQSSISNSYDYNIFVIRDSYGHAMFDYIASSFKKSSFVFDGYFKNNQITNDNPDIVLFETVSRFLKTRLLNVIPKWRIEEINQNINTNINNN